MQSVGQVDPRIGMRQRLLDRSAVFDRDVGQAQQGSQDRGHFGRLESVVATQDPFEFEDDGLAHHQRSPGLDQAPRAFPLAFRFGALSVLDVAAGKPIGIRADGAGLDASAIQPNGRFNAMYTTIDSAGRLVIPKPVRDRLGLIPGEIIEIREREGVLELKPAPTPMKLVIAKHGLAAMPSGTLPPLTDAMVRDSIERSRR